MIQCIDQEFEFIVCPTISGDHDYDLDFGKLDATLEAVKNQF